MVPPLLLLRVAYDALRGHSTGFAAGTNREGWCPHQRPISPRGAVYVYRYRGYSRLCWRGKNIFTASLCVLGTFTSMAHRVSGEITPTSPFLHDFLCLNKGIDQRGTPCCFLMAGSSAGSPKPAYRSAHASEWLPAARPTLSSDLLGQILSKHQYHLGLSSTT